MLVTAAKACTSTFDIEERLAAAFSPFFQVA
jgi:hypothetical protein